MTYATSDEYFTEKEASAFTTVAVKTLQGWRVKGGGPVFIKMGRRVVYARADLLAFIQKSRRTSTSGATPLQIKEA